LKIERIVDDLMKTETGKWLQTLSLDETQAAIETWADARERKTEIEIASFVALARELIKRARARTRVHLNG
jgi:hypothetical protein